MTLPRSITHRAEGWLGDGTGSIKCHPGMQWAYCRKALYLLMDRATLDAAGWSAFDLLDGDLSAAIANCEIDHTVPPAPLVSGRRAALARLRAFCRDALPDYDERRSEPAHGGLDGKRLFDALAKSA